MARAKLFFKNRSAGETNKGINTALDGNDKYVKYNVCNTHPGPREDRLLLWLKRFRKSPQRAPYVEKRKGKEKEEAQFCGELFLLEF